MQVHAIDAAAPGRDEQLLVERLRAGEDRAAEALVRAHGPRMLTVVRRIVGHEEDAQDALQDAFSSAFRNFATFAGDAKLSTWLHRIAVNAALMKVRARDRRRAGSIEDLLPEHGPDDRRMDPATEWDVSPEAVASSHEAAAIVRAAIARLPSQYRTVLVLRDIEELSTEEAAERLRISVGATKVRLHRARQALRTLLEDRFGTH